MGRGEQHVGVAVRSAAAGTLEIALEVALQSPARREALTEVRASET